MKPFPIRFIGKTLEMKYGIDQLTKAYNQYRKQSGLTAVKQITVKRYNSGGQGYDHVPSKYGEFLLLRCITL